MGMSYPPWMTAVVSRPIGLGKVFYTHIWDGDDDNNGIDPGTPFKTITYALSQCVSGRNDYIIVLEGWDEDTPIIVKKTKVHIIGMCCEGIPLAVLTSSQDLPIFQISGDNGDFAEIAGFDLGGGDNHGGIEPLPAVGTADHVYIHHCNFGSEHCGDTPQHGIWLTAGGQAMGWRIQKCKFMGTDAAGGKLTASGVIIESGGHHDILDCLFELCVVPAISLFGRGHHVINNDFLVPTDAAGSAITVLVGGGRNLISNNRACYGEGQDANANPYLDNCGAATTDSWVKNCWGAGMTAPG